MELINSAELLFKQKKYQDTIDICKQLLEDDINSVVSIKLIAKSLFALGNIEKARDYLYRAIDIQPNDYESIKDLGNTYQSMGDITTAMKFYEDAISINSSYAPALNNLGNIKTLYGDKKKGLSLLIKATKLDPELFSAWGNLANCYSQLNNLQEAEIACRKAINLNQNNLDIKLLNCSILVRQNKLKEAKFALINTIEIKPDIPNLYLTLGTVLERLGELEEARKSTIKAIEIKPDFAEAHYNMGNILKSLGKFKEAEISLRKSTEIKPNFAQAYYKHGNILISLGKMQDAEISLRKAIEIKPDYLDVYHSLGMVLIDLGKDEEANYIYKEALKLDPNNLAFNLLSRLSISDIQNSKEQIETERRKYQKGILDLQNCKNLIFNENIIFSTSIFYFAYHNCFDDKRILENIAKILSNVKGIKNNSFNRNKSIEESNKRKKIRLGIVSDHLNNHSVSMYYGNLIKDFNSANLEIIIIKSPSAKKDITSDYIDSMASEVIRLPKNIQSACEKILSSSIDILFYLDIGMSGYTYLLSLLRLALVQVTSVGHPNTSGSPNIDYFISSKAWETNNIDSYFSERLIRLSRIPINYSIPTIHKSNLNLSELNLPNKYFLIGIPHNPVKFHPDFDHILDKILEEIPHAFFFFADSSNKVRTERLKERWSKNSKFIISRTIFHPRVGLNDFLKLVKSFDIMLDPFYFGMGNTFYQAAAFGTPVVSMPTEKFQSRGAYAAYKQMLINDAPIANSKNEYISIAKRLAIDTQYKEKISKQMIINSRKYLFNDKTIYKEYLEFFKASIKAAKENKILPKDWKANVNKE